LKVWAITGKVLCFGVSLGLISDQHFGLRLSVLLLQHKKAGDAPTMTFVTKSYVKHL